MIDSSTENGGRWILMIPTKLAPKHGNSGRQFAFPHHLHQKVCFIVWLAKFVGLFFPFLSHPPKKWIFGPTLPSAIQPSIRPNQWINLFVCGPKKGGGLGGEGAMEGTQTRAKSPLHSSSTSQSWALLPFYPSSGHHPPPNPNSPFPAATNFTVIRPRAAPFAPGEAFYAAFQPAASRPPLSLLLSIVCCATLPPPLLGGHSIEKKTQNVFEAKSQIISRQKHKIVWEREI